MHFWLTQNVSLNIMGKCLTDVNDLKFSRGIVSKKSNTIPILFIAQKLPMKKC